MPPNVKFPADNSIDTTKLVEQLTGTIAPGNNNHAVTAVPPTLTSSGGHAHVDHDDGHGFFLHDIEEAPHNGGAYSNNHHTNDETMIVNSDSKQKHPAVATYSGYNDEQEEDPTIRVKKFVKKYSSLISDPGELSIDSKRLHKVIRDTGEYAIGVQGIALWIFDDDHDRLVQPDGGWWNNPDLPPTEALERLTNPSHPKHVPPKDVSPGTDLAGILWLESSNEGTRRGSVMKHVHSGTNLSRNASHDTLSSGGGGHRHTAHPMGGLQLVWRDLRSLLDDPDTAKGPRLELLSQAGFDKATGIRFETEVNRGMVIFLSCSDDTDEELLNSMANMSYIRQSAYFIGAASAMSDVRRASRAHQDEILLQRGEFSPRRNPLDIEKQVSKKGLHPVHEVSKRSVAAGAAGGGGDGAAAAAGDTTAVEKDAECCVVPRRLKVWTTKVRGGGMQIPPALSYRQSLWTTFGAFCGLLVLSALNEYYQYLSDGDYLLLIGPFGALMTLQYGLTAAPASQPRNAIMGQAVAGAVSLAFTYIPEEILATWLRRAVGPAVGIGVMVKCGFTHPPAGAHAVLYASGQFNFGFYALVVLSTVISVIPATVVNNLSIKRQYPTYWGFIPNWLYVRLQAVWYAMIVTNKDGTLRTRDNDSDE